MRKMAFLCLLAVIVPMVFGHQVIPGVTRGTAGEPENTENPSKAVYRPATRVNDVLFVEDPGNDLFGPPTKPDPMWEGVLTTVVGAGNFGWYGHTTDPSENGAPLATMQQYPLVIWNTYDDWWGIPNGYDPALTTTDQSNLVSYLSGGGRVWLIGQDLIYTGVSTSWMNTNFKLQAVSEDYLWDIPDVNIEGQAEIAGWATMTSSDYQSNGFFSDDLTPTSGGHNILLDTDNGVYNSIAEPNSVPLKTSFWTIDGRTVSSQSDWDGIVHDMLVAFGYTGITEGPGSLRPACLGFAPNAPSHATGIAVISFNTVKDGAVALKVYDLGGRVVASLASGRCEAGTQTVNWNTDEVPGGVYFLRLTTDEGSATHRLTVIR